MVDSIERAIGGLQTGQELLLKSVEKLDRKIEDSNKEHREFHAHIKSKIDGIFEQHEQRLDHKLKEKGEEFRRMIDADSIRFSTKLDPIEKRLSQIEKLDNQEKKETRSWFREISKLTISGVIGALTGYFSSR